MNRKGDSFLRSKLALAVIVTLSASLFVVHAQKPLSGAPKVSAQRPLAGIPEDWSHHRVVFSSPGKSDNAAPSQSEDAKNSRKREAWSRVAGDERYQMQLLRNTLRKRRPLKPFRGGEASRQDLKKDWSMDMGSGATVGAGQYPAKFTFDTTTASCRLTLLFTIPAFRGVDLAAKRISLRIATSMNSAAATVADAQVQYPLFTGHTLPALRQGADFPGAFCRWHESGLCRKHRFRCHFANSPVGRERRKPAGRCSS